MMVHADQERGTLEDRLNALEEAYALERHQRDQLEKKYARLKRRYIRLERAHTQLAENAHEISSQHGRRSATRTAPITRSSPTVENASPLTRRPPRSPEAEVIDLTSPSTRAFNRQAALAGSTHSPALGLGGMRNSQLLTMASEDFCAESPASIDDAPLRPQVYSLLERNHSPSPPSPQSPPSPPSPPSSPRIGSTRRRQLAFQVDSAIRARPRVSAGSIVDRPPARPIRREFESYSSERSPTFSTRSELSGFMRRLSPTSLPFTVAPSASPTSSLASTLSLPSRPPSASQASLSLPASPLQVSDEYHHTSFSRSPSPLRAPTHSFGTSDSREAASLALAQYLQQQENIAAVQEYEERIRAGVYSLPHSSMATRAAIDPDNMTYDELLQLGEEVGDVRRDRWREVALEVLSSLPQHRWNGRSDSDSLCIVCQYNFSSGDEVVTLPCAHVFHDDCVTGWVRNNNSCPLCKMEIANV